jgi:hypothetical protein
MLGRKFGWQILIKKDYIPNSIYFTRIYNKKMFGKSTSVSGPGSTLESTFEIRKVLPKLINEYKINSIADVPCGDLNWMKEVDLKNVNYSGFDIVPNIVEKNRMTFSDMQFQVFDAVEEILPEKDLIICRDLLIHLTNEQSRKVLANFKKSGSKFLLCSTYTNINCNKEIVIPRFGVGFRPLNLSLNPFDLGAPEVIINEKSTEGGGKFTDKSLALWRIN